VRPPITPSLPYEFEGRVNAAEGPITFNWDFGDNSSGPTQGQLIEHPFLLAGVYTVTLRVAGPPCPVTREAITSTVVIVIQGAGPRVYIPVILKHTGTPPTVAPTTETETVSPRLITLNLTPASPGQVSGLQGSVQAGRTRLAWSPNSPAESVLGYRIYRSAVAAASYQLLAESPANVTTYTDDAAACGQMYLVTAYSEAGESLPSTVTYFSPPCR
jgi:PKD repeat protein